MKPHIQMKAECKVEVLSCSSFFLTLCLRNNKSQTAHSFILCVISLIRTKDVEKLHYLIYKCANKNKHLDKTFESLTTTICTASERLVLVIIMLNLMLMFWNCGETAA